MIYLEPNQADQLVWLTLKEGSFLLGDYDSYLVVLSMDSTDTINAPTLAQAVVPIIDTMRISKLEITTVGLTQTGEYRLRVYSQTGTTNTDIEDDAVLGLVEEASARIGTFTGEYIVPTAQTITTTKYG